MTEEAMQEIKRFDPFDNAEEWERYIEERAYLRFETRIKQLQCELEMQRKQNEYLVKQLVSYDMMKGPAPIIMVADEETRARMLAEPQPSNKSDADNG